MVLWEITAITAYFLGLKRTYKIALRIQRRVIPKSRPQIREFVHRRVRDVFNVAVAVHKNIQQRDIEAGRNLGNIILRWLDRIKPSAQIRPHPPLPPLPSTSSIRNVASSSRPFGVPQSKPASKESDGKLLFSAFSLRSKTFPTLPMMMQTTKSAGAFGQYRQLNSLSSYNLSTARRDMVEGVFRKDIAHLILH